MAAVEAATPPAEVAAAEAPPLPDEARAPPPLPAKDAVEAAERDGSEQAQAGSSNEMAGLSEAEQERLLKVRPPTDSTWLTPLNMLRELCMSVCTHSVRQASGSISAGQCSNL